MAYTKAQLEALKNSILASAQPITAAQHRSMVQNILDEMYDAQSRGNLLAGVQPDGIIVEGDTALVIRSGQAYLVPLSALIAENSGRIRVEPFNYSGSNVFELSESPLDIIYVSLNGQTLASDGIAWTLSGQDVTIDYDLEADDFIQICYSNKPLSLVGIGSAEAISIFDERLNIQKDQEGGVASNDTAILNLDTVDDFAGLNRKNRTRFYVNDPVRGGMFSFYPTASGLTPDNGTVFAVADGFAVRSYSGAVNAKWFGAKGDGVTNDTSAIQAAISLGLPVFFSKSQQSYIVTPNAITIPANSVISGDGAVIAAEIGSGFAPIFNMDGDNIELSGLILDQGNITGTNDGITLKVSKGKNIKISNIEVLNGGLGVSLSPTPTLIDDENPISHVVIDKLVSRNNKFGIVIGNLSGVTALTSYIEGVTITNCLISEGREVGSSGDGIKVASRCRNLSICSNVITDQLRDAIDLFACGEKVIISNNIFARCLEKGLDIKSDTANYPVSVYGLNGQGITINSNNIEYCNIGISIAQNLTNGDLNHFINISSNTITYCENQAVLASGKYITLTGNHFFYNCTRQDVNNYAIQVGNNNSNRFGEFINILGNTIVNNGNDGVGFNCYGVYIGSYSKYVIARNNIVTNDTSLDRPFQNVGFYINTLTENITIQNNVSSGHAVSNYLVVSGAGVDLDEELKITYTPITGATTLTNSFANELVEANLLATSALNIENSALLPIGAVKTIRNNGSFTVRIFPGPGITINGSSAEIQLIKGQVLKMVYIGSGSWIKIELTKLTLGSTPGGIVLGDQNEIALVSLGVGAFVSDANAASRYAASGFFHFRSQAGSSNFPPGHDSGVGFLSVRASASTLGMFEVYSSTSGKIFVRNGGGSWYHINSSRGTHSVIGSAQTTISIPHGLGSTPTNTFVVPKSSAAITAGVSSWTEDATNIVISITTPDTGGTLSYYWQASL